MANEPEIIQKYAVVGPDGRPITYLSSEIHADIPSTAIKISDEAWQQAVSNPRTTVINPDGTIQTVERSKIVPTLAQVRQRRDAKLRTSDWTQLPDAPISADQKTAWATYRQALRDMPKNISDLSNFTWPATPSPEPTT